MRRLRARFYSTAKARSYYTAITVKQNSSRPPLCRPIPEEFFAGLSTQSFIHDTVVVFEHLGLVHRFRVFWTQHKCLPLNGSLPLIGCDPGYRGELLAMRVAAGAPDAHTDYTVVNMRAGDDALADEAIRRYVTTSAAEFI